MSNASIHRFEDLSDLITSDEKIICLFSGGLDGAYLLHHLRGKKPGQVLALTVDVGGEDDVPKAARIARRLGATPIVLDEVKNFAANFVLPALQAHSCYLGGHPISASLTRPLLADCAARVAREHQCKVILHSATSSQNSLRRFNGALAGLGFAGIYGTPYEQSAVSREEKQRVLREFGIDEFEHRAHSFDTNFWCREFESGDLEDPEGFEVSEALYRWSRNAPESSLPQAASLTLEFAQGIPVALNGREMGFIAIVHALNEMAGSYGVGRFTGLEEIPGGAKVLEIREMPGAYVLLDAYRRLETACLSSETLREKINIEQIWTREAVEGRWFDPMKRAADAFISALAGSVSGSVKYRLTHNELRLTALKCPKPLYIRDRTLYESELGKRSHSSRRT